MKTRLLGLSTLLVSTLWLGCDSESPSITPESEEAAQKAVPTWYRDIKPIVAQRCEGCHTATGIGPFALSTYQDAQAHAAALADSVKARRMPPWLPSPDCQKFSPERRLSQKEIDLFVAWSQAGAPQGNPADDKSLPPVRLSLESPSVMLDWGEAYTPSAAKQDDYHCFLIDPKLQKDQDLVAYEFAPDQRHEVHHALLYSATMADAKAKDDAAPGLGWPCSGSSDVKSAELVATWVPGETFAEYPTRTGIRIRAGSALIAQLHYNTRHGVTPDRSRLKLRYSESPVPNRATIVPIANASFVINPYQKGATAVASSGPLPVPLKIWGVFPHMHELGRSAKITANNDCLVEIPQWQFHWQQMYFYDSDGITVPKGSEVKYTCTWDNSTGRTIRWGDGTEDEMCIAFFYTTLY